jgi:hypothetical protein
MLESFIVRIYRHEKKKPRGLVGVVEQVGVEEKKAFTNLDELWSILSSIKKEPRQSGKSEIHVNSIYESEKRNEVRIKKEIPFIFIYKKHNFNASTVDFSRNGLGVKIFEKTPLRVGDVSHLHIKDSKAKAQVKWVDKKSDPSMTMAGFKVVDGRLNLKGVKKAVAL